MFEALGVEAKLVRQRDDMCLGIYCARCSAGIALVVLGNGADRLVPEFDWESDEAVRHAIRSHHKRHNAPSAS